ncbi:hypothetical protein [Yersinia mollaretii]|uniref:hypothetical protein n=1 Tax=Yersinia mollaretii TaxID=33060 RepID=UPI0011A8AD06|nr:hypothetical protein [Yersinia mollaretii]
MKLNFTVANLRTTITTAVKNTNGRVHLADTKSLAHMMKEIKNSNSFTRMDNQISKEQADSFTKEINGMMKTLNAQGSGIHKTKMDALTGLKQQLKAITSDSKSETKGAITKRDKHEANKTSELNNNRNMASGLGLAGNTSSHLQFDQ